MPPAMNTYGRSVSAGSDEVSLRLLDVHLRSDRKLGERALEGRVPQPRAEAQHSSLIRRGDDGDVPPQSPFVLVADVGKRYEEVLPGLEVDLLAEQIEGNEERPLRDLLLLLDPRAHGR